MRHIIGLKAWGRTVCDNANQFKYGSSSTWGVQELHHLYPGDWPSWLCAGIIEFKFKCKENVFNFKACQLDEICQHNRYEEATVRTSIETGTSMWLSKKVKPLWLLIPSLYIHRMYNSLKTWLHWDKCFSSADKPANNCGWTLFTLPWTGLPLCVFYLL